MKLRQKLAVVLASAMVVTAVPVVTMAASTNNVTKVSVLAKDTTTTASTLKINAKDAKAGEQFIVTLENAEWANKKVGAAIPDLVGATAVVTGDKEAIVTIAKDKAEIEFPLNVKLLGGEAKVTILGENSSVTGGTFIFAKTPEANKVAAVTADAKTFYTGTNLEVGTITIADTTAASIKKTSESREITLTLDHDDYYFGAKDSKQTLTVEFARGYDGEKQEVTATVEADTQVITFELPDAGYNKASVDSTILGQVKISGLKVTSNTKTPEVGDLNVLAEGKIIADTTVKVATVADYAVSISGDKVDYVSGADAKEVTFKLTESLKDTISRNREIEFSIDNGTVTKVTNPDSAKYDVAPVLDKDGKLTNKFTVTVKAVEKDKEFKVDDKFKFEFKTDVAYEGDITLTASGNRAIGDDLSLLVATATRDFSYDTESAVVKVGLKDQKAGKVVLTETKKGAFEKNKKITLTIPAGEGVKFAGKPSVKVTGDDKFKYTIANPVKNADGDITIDITVDRASVAPVTMTIENFVIDTDRTVPEGTAKLTIGGEAIAANGSKITVDDFFVVGTPNTEALAANGLPKGTATFAIGSAEYKVNDKAATMDAAAYIQDPGYTMVPVRYVATAFGVAEKDILFSAGTATIFAGSRTVQLTAGSDVAIVNGASIKLATKVVVKDGRTYAPVGEIARILGISANWDATAKVATFENK